MVEYIFMHKSNVMKAKNKFHITRVIHISTIDNRRKIKNIWLIHTIIHIEYDMHNMPPST